jgi:hypothetical protein
LDHKTLKWKDSREQRVELCCKDPACSFYLLALPFGKEGLTIQKYENNHTCHLGLFEFEQRSSIPAAFYAQQIHPIVSAGFDESFWLVTLY